MSDRRVMYRHGRADGMGQPVGSPASGDVPMMGSGAP